MDILHLRSIVFLNEKVYWRKFHFSVKCDLYLTRLKHSKFLIILATAIIYLDWNNDEIYNFKKTYRFQGIMSCKEKIPIEIRQIESISHRPLCKRQRQSGNSVRAKERDDGRFFLSLSMRTALEWDSLTPRITLSLARADRFQAGLSHYIYLSWHFSPKYN